MKTSNKKEPIRYKIADKGNQKMQIDFHMNILPYKVKHLHDFWEINIMLQNDCLNIINGREIEFYEQEIQIIRPDDLHYVKKLKSEGHLLFDMEIKREFFEEIVEKFSPSFFKNICEYQPVIPKFKCNREFFEKIVYKIRIAQRFLEVGMETPQFLLKELVTLILFEMVEKFYEEAIDKKEDKSFSNAIIALFNQPENIHLRLNEVCQKYPCSIQYAIRRFKEEGHAETPNKIFQRIKMGYACRLLKTSDLTILSISESIGYNHLGYFNRLFYETYGMTPREYRKRYRNAKQ